MPTKSWNICFKKQIKTELIMNKSCLPNWQFMNLLKQRTNCTCPVDSLNMLLGLTKAGSNYVCPMTAWKYFQDSLKQELKAWTLAEMSERENTHHHHHHHCLWPLLVHRPPTKSSPDIPILGQPFKFSPGVTQTLCFSLHTATPGVSCAALLSPPLWVPGQGLMCSTGFQRVCTIHPQDLIFCWWLLGPFPQFSVADGLRASDQDSSKAGVNECLDPLQCCSHSSSCFSSIKQGRFYSWRTHSMGKK